MYYDSQFQYIVTGNYYNNHYLNYDFSEIDNNDNNVDNDNDNTSDETISIIVTIFAIASYHCYYYYNYNDCLQWTRISRSLFTSSLLIRCAAAETRDRNGAIIAMWSDEGICES